MQGRLISFEGLDGVGKSTQLQLLHDFLTVQGFSVQSYREPGGTAAGEELRALIKAGRFESALAELLAFETARAELLAARIRPALEKGELVLLDRFADSSLAYQGALGEIPLETIRSLNDIATTGLRPHLTIWLALGPQQAMQRRSGALKPASGGGDAESPELDHIEQRDLEYFSRVHDIFQQICTEEPARFLKFDAGLDIASLSKEIEQTVMDMLRNTDG